MDYLIEFAKGLILKIGSKLQITATRSLYRRMIRMRNSNPIISFSFDDAPQTAFKNGGDILNSQGMKATYYTCLGMLGAESPSGIIGSLDDLRQAVKAGHELGCHTFDHRHSRNTKTDVFEKSVLKNREALSKLLPETKFRTIAYPICSPRPLTKLRIGRLFDCCRVGGDEINSGEIDLNLVRGVTLDSRAQVSIDTVKEFIDQNSESNGWLIFYTHDVQAKPSRYGCTEKLLAEVVSMATASGALLLPVYKAYERVTMKNPK